VSLRRCFAQPENQFALSVTASLLVPCYNAANFLPRLWATVRVQTRPFDELLCYDDASSDDTAAVAQSLGATVIRGERNAGPAFARNELWRAAHGEWVHFHDADDLLRPDFLEKMATRATDATDVVICDAEWQQEHDRRPFLTWRYSEAALRAEPAAYLLSHPVGGINGFYRRTALEKIGGFNTQLHIWEDADLHVRLGLSGARFAVVEEPLVIGLRRGDSLSAPLALNWFNRLVALEGYAQLRATPAFARALATEAEQAASAFALLRENAHAARALSLCHRLGVQPPTSHQFLIRALKPFVAPVTLLRWQADWRRRAAARS
jgi:glycosyltransferase involved in cell wall biosynthesis